MLSACSLALFNHAARFYGLKANPARQAGNMGTEERKEMLFWTREEYTKFSEAMMDKPLSFYAFEMLYWCGLREGELLALTPADFDFEKRTVTINKSYQRLNKQDLITDPKTPKSNRIIQMPQFLCDEIQDYLKQLYGVQPDSRMFPVTKSYLHREMDRGCKETGVKRIRIAGYTRRWRYTGTAVLPGWPGISAAPLSHPPAHAGRDTAFVRMVLPCKALSPWAVGTSPVCA